MSCSTAVLKRQKWNESIKDLNDIKARNSLLNILELLK